MAKLLVVLTTVVTALVLASCDGDRSAKEPQVLDEAVQRTALPSPTTSRHLIVNRDGSNRPRRVGFNLFDTGPTREIIRGLPGGVQALVWLGQKCPTTADRSFRRTVRRLAKLRKVYGYFLSDEPHIDSCPGGPLALRTRADFIEKVSAGRQISFIVLDEKRDYRAFRPRRSHVELFGIDPYPCSTSNPGCDLSKINADVNDAVSRGIKRWRVVPVYQAFGQENTADPYYLLPSPSQLSSILERWAQQVPHPRFDYTYSWGHQSSSNPTLIDSSALQEVFATYFAG